jgi:hypothetical protein
LAVIGIEHRQLKNSLQAARYRASRAHRQCDAVEPDNRLVASELELRWNERLARESALEDDVAKLSAGSRAMLSHVDRDPLMTLGADMARAWTVRVGR